MFADRERAKEYKKKMKAEARAKREAEANQAVAQDHESVVQVADLSQKMVEAKQLAPETNKLQALFMA